MKRTLSTLLAALVGLGLVLLGSGTAQAAPSDGTRDAAFASTGLGSGQGFPVVVDSQGRVVVGGSFTTAEGASRGRIARYLADGTLDTTFATGVGFDGPVQSLAIDGNGNILVGGGFAAFNGTTANRIARLTSTGTLDTTFTTGTGFDSNVLTLTVDAGGRIVAGGFFATYNGTTANRIARLTSTGTLDTTFTTGTGFDNNVLAVAIDSSGRILTGGLFTAYNGTTVNRIARLTSTGTLDTTFTTGTSFDNYVRALVVDGNGAVVVGGQFTTYNGTTVNRIARLSSTGALDTTFTTGTGFDSDALSLALDGLGNIVVGGSFSSYRGTAASRIARLTSTGALDTTFTTGTGFDAAVRKVVVDSYGNVVAAGTFSNFNGAPANGIARLTTAVSVSYDLGGGTGTAPTTQTTTAGRAVTLATGSGLARTGYAFGGWNTAVNGSGTALPAGAAYTPTSNTTLYAQWTVIPNPHAPNPNTPTPAAATGTVTLTGGPGSLAANAPVAAAATGLLPGSTWTITMFSTPVVLATGVVPASGAVQTSATLPASVTPGHHRIELTGTAADGSSLLAQATFRVDEAGTIDGTGVLAATGVDDAVPLTALGSLLLLSGTVALIATRRRQH